MREYIPHLGLAYIIVGVINTLLHLMMCSGVVIGAITIILDNISTHEPIWVDLLESLDETGPILGAAVLMMLWVVLSVGFIVSGVMLRKRRGRWLGLTVAVVGLIPCLASHPFCTYVLVAAVCVFAIVVLVNPDVAEEFS